MKKLKDSKLNCIFCKYYKDLDKCQDTVYDNNWRCPTIINIYYGKMIKYFPFNIIYKISCKIKDIQSAYYYDEFNEDCTENNDMKFIWGIKSYDDLTSGNKANLLTMNDIDLIYNKKTQKYSISIETFFQFKDESTRKNWLVSILNTFTRWMKENNYNTNYNPFMDLFSGSVGIDSEFDSIEQAYAVFKTFVLGYYDSDIEIERS